MSGWSLPTLLKSLHGEVEYRLSRARVAMGHNVAKGDASETVWLDVLGRYLPKRYTVAKAFVVDSQGNFSQQIDLVIFDRQYSPFIFEMDGQCVVPAESVYAAFEAKQAMNAEQIAYAQKKIESVRKLVRTSLPIPHAGGRYDAREPQHILGGLLTLESDWKPPLGDALADAIKAGGSESRLDLGCVAAAGYFTNDKNGVTTYASDKAATAFIFELLARLQDIATVAMVDIRAYAKWLDK
jgi:hypothetical protein